MTLERAQDAFNAGARTSGQLAAMLGLSERQALRWLNRISPSSDRNPARPCSPETYARMGVLAQEGVPSAWIAEDVGYQRRAVDRYRERQGVQSDGEYKAVCQSIRRNPVLLALHREFAPKA